MPDRDFDSRPIRIEARRRQHQFNRSETTRPPAESPLRPPPNAGLSAPLHPGCPYYCSWDLESCLRYWM